MARVRASWAKTVISAAKRLDGDLRVRALGAMPEEARLAVRQTATLAWIDTELMVELCAPAHDALGPDAHRLWTSAMMIAIEAPLLRPLRAGAFSLFGKDPYKIVKMTPHVWGLITRECGHCGCRQPDTGVARLELDALDPSLRSHAAFVAGIGGAATAMIEQCGLRATVHTDTSNLRAGKATIEASWVAAG